VAVFEGEGALTATLAIEPRGDGPVLNDLCTDDEAPNLAAGAELELAGDTLQALDDYDSGPCGGGGGGADVVLQFRVNEAVEMTAIVEADFDALLMLLDGECGGAPVCPAPLSPDELVTDLAPGAHTLVVDGAGLGQAGELSLRLSLE